MVYTEVKYMPERSRIYLGSPALIRLPDGAIVACHDYFYDEPEAFRGSHPRLTAVYRSEDDGRSFQHISNIIGAFWSTLFLHRGALYLLGCDRCFGSIVIRRSDDGGFSWSWPVDETSGLLFRGGEGMTPPNYHGAPVPVAFHNGRIYRAFEDNVTGHWPTGFQALVISAPEDADLLDAASWRMSNKLPFDAGKVPADWGDHGPGFLEGNVIAGPDGTLWDIMRLSTEPYSDYAAMVKVSPGGETVSLDYEHDIIHLPGGTHKFTIRRDPVTGIYLTLSNNNTVPGSASQRNILSLSASENLRDWRVVKTLLRDESGLREEDSIRLTGFQYADWQFDGDDLICLVRTAYRGAVRFHDSNRITFHVLKGFRNLLKKEG